MLSPRSISVLGLGFGPEHVAKIGFVPITYEPKDEDGEPPLVVMHRARRRDDDALFLALLM